jgi:hypothetical protein
MSAIMASVLYFAGGSRNCSVSVAGGSNQGASRRDGLRRGRETRPGAICAATSTLACRTGVVSPHRRRRERQRIVHVGP